MLTICSRIVVPYDQSPLSNKALEMAMLLASKDERIDLHVIRVVNKVMSVPYYSALDIGAQFEAQYQAAKSVLTEVEKKLDSLPNHSKTFILVGNPAEMITGFVKQNDLIVVGSRGLSG